MNDDSQRVVELEREVRELSNAIETLNGQKFFTLHGSWPRFIWTSFVRGIFVGLGSVLGATVVLYFLIQFLNNIDFIPIVGEWASQIVMIINDNNTKY